MRIKGEHTCEMFASLGVVRYSTDKCLLPLPQSLNDSVGSGPRERKGRERELRAASASVSNSDNLERGRAGLKQLITAKFPEDLIFSITLPFI